MMHVLVVSPHLPPAHVGGVEVYSQYLLRAFRARGHRVQGAAVEHVTSGVEACTALTDDADGYPTHRLTLSLPPSRPFPLLAGHPAAEAWFARLLGETAPDVVHVQSGYLLGAPAMAAARRAGIPVVLTLHDYWFACPRVTLRHPSGEICSGPERPSKCAWCLTADRRRYQLLDRLSGGAMTRGQDRSRLWQLAIGGPVEAVVHRQQELADLLRSAAVVLAPTRFVAAQVAAGTGYPLEAIRLSRYGMPPIERVRRTPGATLRLAFIGQLAPHKGVHLAVDAVRALPDRPITLDVYGPLTPYPGVRGAPAIAGRWRSAHHFPRALPARGAARRVRGHRRRGRALGVARGGGDRHSGSAGGGPAGDRLHTRGVAGTHPRRSGRPALRSGRSHSPTRQLARLLDEPGLRAALDAAAPQPRTIDDEVDALLALYASLGRAA